MKRKGRAVSLTLLSALCLGVLALSACALRGDETSKPDGVPADAAGKPADAAQPTPTDPEPAAEAPEEAKDENKINGELLRVTVAFTEPEEGETVSGQQERMIARIEELIGRSLDVKWRFTRSVNAISAYVTEEEMSRIAELDGVKAVTVETLNEPTGIPARPGTVDK